MKADINQVYFLMISSCYLFLPISTLIIVMPIYRCVLGSQSVLLVTPHNLDFTNLPDKLVLLEYAAINLKCLKDVFFLHISIHFVIILTVKLL